MSDEVTIQRLRKESEALERYEARLLEAAAQLKVYRAHHGHEPASSAALRAWIDATYPQPLDPYAVLTREEIMQLWEDAEY
jgi:hypothetical protein